MSHKGITIVHTLRVGQKHICGVWSEKAGTGEGKLGVIREGHGNSAEKHGLTSSYGEVTCGF